MSRSLSILVTALLSGCVLVPGPDTPSGNLEISVSNVRPDCAHQVMASALVSNRYQIESHTEYRIVARRSGPEDYGTERVSVLFLRQPETAGLTIIIYPQLVGHPGTAFESYYPTHPTQRLQDRFNVAKQQIQDNCSGGSPTRRG